jgi:glutamate-5-semialdehyde dehydrogenase
MEIKAFTELIVPALEQVKEACRQLTRTADADIRRIILALADLAEAEAPALLAANALDLARMDPADPKYDRLRLDEQRLAGIAAELRHVAELPSPLGRRLEQRILPNGLELSRVSTALGVVGVVYESRPNVTFDVFALCLRAGNATVLKGSRDAADSNRAIHALIQRALAPYGLENACYLAPAEREALSVILEADAYLDVIIPRGSQSLIDFVRRHARVPVIETGAGIVHTYLDAGADPAAAAAIITNAKARRVSVCNALDCLLVHVGRLNDLPQLLAGLAERQCQIHADPQAMEALRGHYPAQLLAPATPDSFGTEFLSMQLAIRTVGSLDEALQHIARYGSRHSEAILSTDEAAIDRFLREVDAAAVYANASTAFTDGAQFGLGAEIGISTQKLHARGPMGLEALTSYKWMVRGQGQTRP